MPALIDPNLIVGLETGDDAGVYRIAPDQALVLTTDFFTPVHDDPLTFGRVVGANCLSDVYAMGGRPILALNVVGFPEDKLPLEALGEMLRGGAQKAAEAGVAVAGGHSLNNPEPFYGMVVLGMVHPDRVVTNAGAKTGDRLVLTKPLGTGIIVTATTYDRAGDEARRAVVESMTMLNKDASEVMVQHGATAATDITGFGLIGHALEMAHGGGVGLRVSLEALPALPGALEYAAQEIVTGVGLRNHNLYGDRLEFGSASQQQIHLACDPQTSGGLLISFPPERAEAAVQAMQGRGVPAVEIGRAVSDHPGELKFV